MSGYTIYVGNLASSATGVNIPCFVNSCFTLTNKTSFPSEKDIRDTFGNNGQITKVEICCNYAFVTFQIRTSIQSAVNTWSNRSSRISMPNKNLRVEPKSRFTDSKYVLMPNVM